MSKFLAIPGLLALLIMGTAPLAIAQEAEAEAQEAPAAQPATRAQTPQEITAAVHGSWQIRCVTTEPKQCFLYQLIVDNERNTPLMEVTLFSAKDETGQDVKMVANAVTPLGVLLGRGLIMQVDEKDPIQRQFGWCAPQGCYSRFPVTGAELADIQAGSKIVTAFFMVQNPSTNVELELPLDGFGEAYDELMKIEEEQKSE